MVAAIALAFAASATPAFAQVDSKPEQLFVLGDSLSDVGNAAAAADFLLGQPVHPASAIGLCNPSDIYVLMRNCEDLFYRKSRVSDGPVAVEHLAVHLELPALVPSFHVLPNRTITGTSYAVASGKAQGAGAENLARQVDMLIFDHGPLLSPTALYVVMIGGNDAIDALQATLPAVVTSPEQSRSPPGAIIAAAVAAIGANVERLIDFGARRIIVANVPDLAVFPGVRQRARATADETATLAAASAISAAFNAALDARLDGISRGRWTIRPVRAARFDLAAVMRTEQAAAAASGLNAIDACFDSETYLVSTTAERMFHPDCAPQEGAPDFAGFLFWDGIHPTGAAHAAIGAALIELYESSPLMSVRAD